MKPGTAILRYLRRTRVGGPIEYLGQFLDGIIDPKLLHSGATDDEKRRHLPGDDLVPDPVWEATRAVTVEAPARQVWPWVAQMVRSAPGCRRSLDRKSSTGVGQHH